jgi:hypothetical protein
MADAMLALHWLFSENEQVKPLLLDNRNLKEGSEDNLRYKSCRRLFYECI